MAIILANEVLLVFAPGVVLGFALGFTLKILRNAWATRQIRDLELRLESKHNALKIAIAGRDEALERLRGSWQARSDEAANRNAVQCGVQRADGAPCTLEREHLGQRHSYAGAEFERIFDGFACPLCGRQP